MYLDETENVAKGADASQLPLDDSRADDGRYAKFQSFTLGDWIDWLNAFMAGYPRAPFIRTGRDELPHETLIDLYKGLAGKTDRDIFARAIESIYRSTQRIDENKELLFYLLHLIAYTIPIGGKDLLRQRLYETVLNHMEFAGQNLQTLLLIANSKYEIDDDLLDFIFRSARVSEDFRHLLACLRILGLRGGAEAYPFMEYLLPQVISETRSFQLARQLRGIGARIGYRQFLVWYMQNSRGLAREWPEQWVLFERGIKNRLLTEKTLKVLCKSDPDAGFLAGFVHANLRELLPSTVLDIARLYKIAGRERTIDYLYDIWRRGNEKWHHEPWVFLTPDETLQRTTAGITNGRDRPTYREAFFDSSIESELEEILLTVQDRYDSLIAGRSRGIAVAA